MTADEAIAQVRFRIDDVDDTVYPESVDTSDIVAKSKYQHENTNLKFTDLQILSEVQFAVNAYNSDYTLATLPEDKEFIPITKACISCLRSLAMREARNYKISVDGISISKSDRVTNYLNIAKALEDGLNETMESAGFAEIEVENVARYNVRTNNMSYSPD